MTTLSYLSLLTLGVLIGAGIPLGLAWYAFPWQRPLQKTKYVPSFASLNYLETLIKLLGEVHHWFGSNNNPIVQGLQKGLWELMNYLKLEQDCCKIIFSPTPDDSDWILRRLSRNKSKRVQAVIQAISEHGNASEEIRSLARSILQANIDASAKAKKSRTYNAPKRSQSKNASADNPVIYSENTVIHMEDGTMSKQDGDTYHVGQAGSVGPNSEAHHFQMTQGSNTNYDGMNPEMLIKELETLRMELRKLPQTAENDRAIGAIASAEIEIQSGDNEKAKEHLKQAGILALDTAIKIGIGLAIAALRAALGLP